MPNLRFLTRVALAVGGVMLVCAVGYLGLGWMVVMGRTSWLPMSTQERLWRSYYTAAGTFFPGDRDGDGEQDGCEWVGGSNLNDPMTHGNFEGWWNQDGVTTLNMLEHSPSRVRERIVGPPVDSNFHNWTIDLYPKAGERFAARGRLTLDSRLHSFPRGFQVRITPPDGILAALPGGTPAATPLIIPVAVDGSLGFDLLMAKPVDESALEMQNAVSGDVLVTFLVSCVWPREPIVPKVEKISLNAWLRAGGEKDVRGDGMVYRLRWDPVSPRADNLLIEAARDEAGAEWFPISGYDYGDVVSSAIVQIFSGPSEAAGSVRSYAGPLKFRIVPATDKKPE